MSEENPQPAKMTAGELKAKYNQLAAKNKTQKQKIEQLLQNQQVLQEGLKFRDEAIESRDIKLKELQGQIDDLSSQLQLKIYQNNELFSKLTEQEEQENKYKESIRSLKIQMDQQQKEQETFFSEQNIVISNLNDERRKLLEHISELEKEKQNGSQQIQVSEKVNKLAEECQSYKDENMLLKDQINKLKENIVPVSTETKVLDTTNDNEISAKYQKATEDLSKAADIIQKLQSENQTLKNDLEAFQNANEEQMFGLSEEPDKATLIRNEYEAFRRKATESLQQKESEIIKLKQQNSTFAQHYEQMKNDVINKAQITAMLHTQIQQANEKISQYEQSIQSMKKQAEEIPISQEMQQNIENQNGSGNLTIDNLTQQIASMKEFYSREFERIKTDSVSSLKAKELENNQLRSYLNQSQSEASQAKQQLSQITETFERQKGQLSQALSELQRYQSLNQQLQQSNNEYLQRIQSLQEEITNYQNAIHEYKNSLSIQESMQKNLTTTTETVKSLRQNITELEIEIQHLKGQNEDLADELENTKLELNAVTERAEGQKAELTQLKPQNHQLQYDLETTVNLLNQMKEESVSARSIFQSMQKQMESSVGELEKENTKLKEALTTVQAQFNESQQKVDELAKSLNARTIECEDINLQIRQVLKQKEKLEQRKRTVDKKNIQLEREMAEIKQKTEAIAKDRAPAQGKQPPSTLFPGYMRKVLLQFFLQDGSTREALIPVILNLVECDDKLVQQAKRSWAESQQIVSRPFHFF